MTISQATEAPTYVFERMPQTDEELWWFIQAVWGVRIPRTRVCPGHCSPFDALADAYFARSSVSVWYASRGFGGKTRTLAALTLTEAVALGAQASILGGSGGQSINIKNASDEYWHNPNAPKGLLSRPPTTYYTHFKNGAYIKAQMASQTSVRGDHPQRLRLDEIDEMDYGILTAAQGQPMRKRNVRGEQIETQTVMSSTWQYPDKTMSIIMKEAKAKGWPIYSWCYKESANPVDGWLTHEEVDRKRSEVPERMFEMEYDLQEPSFEGRAIDTSKVELAFNPAFGEYEGDWNEYIQIREPDIGRKYITGIDWAKEKDWTIIATFDATTTPWVCVAWQRQGRKPWPLMIQDANEQANKFNSFVSHDATGIGNVVADYLEIRDDKRDDVIVGGGRARMDLFSEYISGIENEMIVYPRIDFAYQEHKYVTLEDLYGTGHPPDSFISGAVAWRQRTVGGQITRPVSLGKASAWRL